MEEDNGVKKNNNNNRAARINLLKVQKYVNLKESVIQLAKYFVPSWSLFVAMWWHGAERQATERSANGVSQGLKKIANMGQCEVKDLQLFIRMLQKSYTPS